jgi:Trypsin-like peptidase domain
MSGQDKVKKYSIEELLKELRAREAKKSANAPEEAFHTDEGLKNVDSEVIARELRDKQKVIYGTDNRVDLFQINDPLILGNADGVVALFDRGDVVDNGNGTSTIQTQNFGIARNLCATERFRDQPIGCFCSGFLVAPDIITTAGHCVDNAGVNNVRFVFGFRMVNASNATTIVNNTEIYRGIRIVGRQLINNGADWALVQTDRPVTNHRIVQIRREGRIGNNQGVYVIGHPVGLPTKFADGANVRDNSPAAFFIANLDTYGGNSGSPVFNRDTHIVEGILVRGETDFTSQGTCNVSLVCPDTGCRGEDCTRTTEFQNLVGIGWRRFELAPAGSASVNGGIAAVSRIPNSMEVWWIGANGSVQDAFWYEGAQWRRFELAPAGSASVNGGITAVSRIPNSMEVWWIGANGSVQDAHWYDGSPWRRFELAPAGSASTGSGIAAVSRIPNSMELWWIGANGSVQGAFWYEGSRWTRYELAPAPAPAGSASVNVCITAVSRIPNSMEVWWIGLQRAAIGTVQGAFWYEGSRWTRYVLAPIGSASVNGCIAAVSRIPNSMELWWIGANGSVQGAFWYE